VIGIRKGKLYRLMFQPNPTLFYNSSSDLCELWYMRMAHLHHVDSNVMKDILIGLLEFSVDH
jgi:hypothetical protein